MALPYKILVLAQTTSTNSYLLERPELLRHPGQVVRSIRQTAGRGRRGRVWEGGSGNLYFSLVFDPSGYDAPSHSYTLLAGLALHRALEVMGLKGHGLKWPNDLLWEDRKLAGILTERKVTPEGERLVIGIGVNILGDSSQFGLEIKSHSVTLEETEVITGPEQVLEQFLKSWHKLLQDLQASGLGPLFLDWEGRSQSMGKRIWFESQGNWQRGLIQGLGSEGGLLVTDGEGNLQQVMSGETSFTPPRETP